MPAIRLLELDYPLQMQPQLAPKRKPDVVVSNNIPIGSPYTMYVHYVELRDCALDPRHGLC